MKTQSGFSYHTKQTAAEQREDLLISLIIGISLFISAIIAIWFIASTINSPPRYYPDPMPYSQLRWNDIR